MAKRIVKDKKKDEELTKKAIKAPSQKGIDVETGKQVSVPTRQPFGNLQTGVGGGLGSGAGADAALEQFEIKKEQELLSQQEELREEKVPELLGSDVLKEELIQKTEGEGLNLQPPPIKNPLGGVSNFFNLKAKAEEAGLQVVGTPVPIGTGGLSLGLFSKVTAKLKIASMIGGTSSTISTLAVGILGTIGLGKAVDFRRKEINNLMASVTKTTGESSTILSAVQNGLSVDEGMQRLKQLSDSVNEAEASIKQLAIYNLNFRISKEHRKIQQEIKDARLNILERVGGVENVAIYGRAALDPEALLYDVSQYEEE